ncbi:PhzF family phenazine biosynthesis protein [Geomicrobium sp. JCM 19038]|uniref:PhzF family phenazine biosynthesis protein n=1 Tax=Geomicrobium sp. JCM 19038 TaxID=1460635 RepID=UPI00045F4435|nr:PhzF family phenazine biosynthesis protein [Geomicrobium sp. JCM 19038]GAK08314.1 phenazine biosynthesis protein PhzF [Geomicrobium sp. JCM 19038]
MDYYVVDAFAEKVFEGNPAGVCVMDRWLDDETMQKIAVENNLSETAFTVKAGDVYHLRWFTPGGEIDLCGHATLGTAYVVCNYYELETTDLTFHTMSGELLVKRKGDLYEMDFPSRIPEIISSTAELEDVLGFTPLEVYLGRDVMVVAPNEELVEQFSPNFEKIKQLQDGIGLTITASSTTYDFVSRCFFPKLQVNEDPVCGSAHCNFIPYWEQKLGKSELVARQLSARGGTLYCKSEGDRVKISGYVTLYSKATLFIGK